MMTKFVELIRVEYQTRLTLECPNLDNTDLVSILHWLLGEDLEIWEKLSPEQLEIARRRLDDRLSILTERYLEKSPQRAYQNLMERLGGFISTCARILLEVSIDRDFTHTVVDTIEAVIQVMSNHDLDLPRQRLWIGKCTSKSQLRNALLLTTIEASCLGDIRNRSIFATRCLSRLEHSLKKCVAN
jgi:hypothetical protein